MQFKFSALLVFVVAAVSVQAAPIKPTAAASAITITAPGVAGVAAKPDGCAHITPVGQDAQNVCAKSVTATGFKLTVTDLKTNAKSSCTIEGTSGTCGKTGAGAEIGAAAAAVPAKAPSAKAKTPAAKSAVTITAPGVAGVAAKPDGCAHITPEGANAQNVCAKSITAKGFKLTVTDLTTNAKSSCTITGTSGTCGATGAGATVAEAAKRDLEEELEERADAKPNTITITGKGAADVGANHLGCAHVTPAGEAAQLVCTSDFTAKGFSISVKNEKTAVRTSCVVEGTSGTCGPSGAGAKVSNLPKRDIEEDLEERADAKPNSITITGKGAADVGANHLGCAHVTPAGEAAQLVCTSDFTATGFSISVKDEKTAKRTSCVVKGTSGTCGPSGAGAKVSNLPKREVEEDFEEPESDADFEEDEDEE